MRLRINEVLRADIIKASKVQSPDRLQRSKKYSAKDFKDVNFKDLFERDTFTWTAKIGTHMLTISFEGAFEELKWFVKGMRGPNRVNRISQQIVAEALSKALDTNDLYVDCDCGDWIYRFSYFATQKDYKYGKPENRPPKITNPNDNKGLACKHILSVLAGKRWVPSAAKAWLAYMKANVEITESFLWDMDIKRAKEAERKKRREAELAKAKVNSDSVDSDVEDDIGEDDV